MPRVGKNRYPLGPPPPLGRLRGGELSSGWGSGEVFQYATGRTVTTRMRAPMPPAKIVTPTGIQNDEPAIIIGMTPTAVVAVVRKMGTMRRRPAS